MNDCGDDSPEGQLTDGILDQLAKFERAKTAERSRRGKLRKAREGKVLASRILTYGFRYNAARDGYEVEPRAMAVVRRIFEMVGAQGESIYGVCRALESEGIASPTGKMVWAQPTVKDILRDDAYRPLDHGQLQLLVDERNLKADVLARLDREKRYGIWWFNRAHRTNTRVSVETPTGREYKTRSKTVKRPRSEWIAVPVPDSGMSADEELDEDLARIEEGRAVAQWELEALRDRRHLLENLKRDRDVLLEFYVKATPEALDALLPEERNRVYKLLKLRVTLSDDRMPQVSGVFCDRAELESVFVSKNDVPASLSV